MPKAGERKQRPDDDHWMLALWAKRERHRLVIERRACDEPGSDGHEYRVACSCGYSSAPRFTRPSLEAWDCAVWSALDSRTRRLEGDVRERVNWTDYERKTQQKASQRWERL